MCGKFFSRASWRKLTGYTDLLLPAVRATEEESVLQTPMRVAPVVCLDEHGKRVVAPMRWGWIDSSRAGPAEKAQPDACAWRDASRQADMEACVRAWARRGLGEFVQHRRGDRAGQGETVDVPPRRWRASRHRGDLGVLGAPATRRAACLRAGHDGFAAIHSRQGRSLSAAVFGRSGRSGSGWAKSRRRSRTSQR